MSETTTIRALTVYPVWAWAIVHGHKPVENRNRNFNYRGPLAIHASADSPAARRADIEARNALANLGIDVADEVPRGALIGTVDLVDCVDVEVYRFMEAPHDLATGPKCLILENPQPFENPIAAIGKHGLWTVENTESFLRKGRT